MEIVNDPSLITFYLTRNNDSSFSHRSNNKRIFWISRSNYIWKKSNKKSQLTIRPVITVLQLCGIWRCELMIWIVCFVHFVCTYCGILLLLKYSYIVLIQNSSKILKQILTTIKYTLFLWKTYRSGSRFGQLYRELRLCDFENIKHI